MIDIKDLRLIEALYEHKTFTRAARALQIPQPVLSRHLMQLERKLGLQLFIRRRSGSFPTDLGRSIIAKGRTILSQINEIEETLASINGTKISEISIVSGSFTTETILTEVAARAISALPKTRLTLKSINWTDIEADVLARRSSMGLLHLSGQIFDASLSVEKLCSHPVLFFVRPGHPLIDFKSISLTEIMAFPIVAIPHIPSKSLDPRVEARKSISTLREAHPAFPAIIHSSPVVSIKIVKKSDAVMAASLALAFEDVRRGSLVALPFYCPPLEPVILSLRMKVWTEEEKKMLALIRQVDKELEAESLSWCAMHGLPVVAS
jgi:DNA-binding transcriptional LysR family regulator